jgi:flagellar biosynthesis/type III secretory pathway protein FliH
LAENTEAETTDVHTVDYSTFQKNDFVELLSKLLDDVKEQPSVAAFRKSEDVLKEVRPLFEQFKTAERAEALAKFKEANDGSEDGFEFKFDETIEKFDKLFKALKEERAKYFNQIEKRA